MSLQTLVIFRGVSITKGYFNGSKVRPIEALICISPVIRDIDSLQCSLAPVGLSGEVSVRALCPRVSLTALSFLAKFYALINPDGMPNAFQYPKPTSWGATPITHGASESSKRFHIEAHA